MPRLPRSKAGGRRAGREMLMSQSYELGKSGEDIAIQYLSRKGYRIIGRNFRARRGEIDIIAEDKNVLVFVEVKNYSCRSFYRPIYSISRKKMMRICRAAKVYLYKNNIKDRNCRFDTVFIYRDKCGKMEIDLIKQAFL